MHHSQINVRYARSLFLLAGEKDIIEEVRKDIDIVYKAFEEIDDFRILLDHPIIKSSKKTEILNSLFKEKLNKYTLSFLLLVVKNKRENHLKNICTSFFEIYKKNKGIKTAVLTTSYALSDNERDKIQKAIEHNFKTAIEMHERVDESLIGGMIIQVDDKQLDLSVVKQIHQLRNAYINIDFNK